jgi:hypothetical protein
VGVNNGKAFTRNPCLASQYHWAKGGQSAPAVYINLHYPSAPTVSSLLGPAGLCSFDEAHCHAYNFGYNAARYATVYAGREGVRAATWWLDVETENTWSADVTLNQQVITGAIAYLEQRHQSVGIYSTPYQWGEIAGRFAPGLPVWTAGAEDLAEARARCGNPAYAFGGGSVQMVQFIEEFDTNVVCP